MRAKIIVVHEDDAYSDYPNVIGMTGEVHAETVTEKRIGGKKFFSFGFTTDGENPKRVYFYAARFIHLKKEKRGAK